MADIYTLFRGIISDSTSPYSIPDLRVLKYLDEAIIKLSYFAPRRIEESITIDSSDITNGYVDVSEDIHTIIDIPIGVEIEDWQVQNGNRIRFIQNPTVGTYTFKYNAIYTRFKGTVKENADLNYPREADLGLVFYALGLYQAENGVIKADGINNVVTSKSEEGLSISYATLSESSTIMGNPTALMNKGIEMMKNLPNSKPLYFSISI